MIGEEFPSKSKIPRSDIEEAQRHLFMCIGPDCCSESKGQELWDLLKSETKHLSVPVLRTKAGCLRICKDGPWLVVYPDGLWYGNLTAERLRRILKQHVEEGHPVREWISARMPCLVQDTPED